MPMQAQRGGGSQLKHLHNLHFRRFWVVSSTPRPLYPEKDSALVVQETRWTSGHSGQDMETLFSTGIRYPTPLADSAIPAAHKYFTFRYGLEPNGFS